MITLKKINHFGLKVGISVVATFGLVTLFQIAYAAWQDPPAGCDPNNDPGSDACKVSAPLNVSDITQTKLGQLIVGGLLTGKAGLKIEAGDVVLPNETINGNEIKNGDVTEADLAQIATDENTGSGLDASEIDDIYLRSDKSDIMNGTLGVIGAGGIAATFKGNVSVEGNLTATGVIEAQDTGHFKGKGTELIQVQSLQNQAAGGPAPEIKTASFIAYINSHWPVNVLTINLSNYGIPGNGKSIMPLELQGIKCLNCVNQEFIRYDPTVEENLKYTRCNGSTFRNIITMRGDRNQSGYYIVTFSYYEYTGSQCSSMPFDPNLVL